MTAVRRPSSAAAFAAAGLCALVTSGCGEGRSPSAAPAVAAAPEGMVLVPAGRYRIGPGEDLDAPEPAREVELRPFWIDEHEVTNAQFERFVRDAGYVTEAERIGNSAVFDFELHGEEGGGWRLIDGADWRHPAGPGTSIEGLARHPVVNVSWNDAAAFAAWANKRLPSDEEWEAAARGGRAGATYPWGDELEPEGAIVANYWQGIFPVEDRADDGWRGTSPVKSFPPNGYGLFDMGGNVWEWTAGPGLDAAGQETRATRGGSFLCRERAAPGSHACMGYRVVSRQFKILEDGNSNVGFRCAADAE